MLIINMILQLVIAIQAIAGACAVKQSLRYGTGRRDCFVAPNPRPVRSSQWQFLKIKNNPSFLFFPGTPGGTLTMTSWKSLG